ncbi:MAG TPA: DNA replication/repair protein RecF [Chloroflexota bacterium]|nr:DNA replication/repair protein RecF [Chloroflexota bacterium]
MHLERLALAHYRNYAHLDARFKEGVIILHGANAQGKTNLLEAIYLLATTKSSRTRSDADLITWGPPDPFSPVPFARIAAHVERTSGPVDLEIVVVQEANGQVETPGPTARKRFKLNGVPRRAGEVLGQVNAVLFAPTDVDIVAGSPSLRRRYLDVILCQVHPSYYRALQGYNKVLLQRNSLLRQVRERQQPADTLLYWNEKLVEYGTTVVVQRADAVAHLSVAAAEMHERVSGGRECLEMAYLSSVSLEGGGATGVRGAFESDLAAQRQRELAAGVSLVGPHRDDLGFAVGGTDMTQFGSRGQQRSVALAIKLAELAYIRREAGEWPILLLDDATSELDAVRRAAVLEVASEHPQVFLTTAEPQNVMPAFDDAPQIWHVESGTLSGG